MGKDTLIINMGSVANCPSKKLGLCKVEKCYAKKAEIQYWHISPEYRNRQEKIWLENDAIDIAESIQYLLSFDNRRDIPIKYIRFNESGDFHSADCLQKLIDIATMIPQIKFYTYTHRSDLITNYTWKRLPKNLVINTSNFKRTNMNMVKVVTQVKVHSMKGIAKVQPLVRKYATYACMGDCFKCAYCKVNHGKDIGIPLH